MGDRVWRRSQSYLMMDSLLELVIARHEEDLRWIRRVPKQFRITVYNKGDTSALPEGFPERSGLTVASLTNVGREAHTYLTHLIDRYENPAPVTVFCQGHPFDHAPDFHERLRALATGEETVDQFQWYGFLEETDDPQGRRLFVPWSKNPKRLELETGRLYRELFGEESPEWFHFRGGAQFAIKREAFQSRGKDFYLLALDLCLSIPRAAHSFERMWDRFFGDPVIDPTELGPDGVRYLKRIRRLEEAPPESFSPTD
ncbi:MAG: DUF3431 domain-containing protein [Proteobacteria bacterium]|nr:DUF3431 domain-containing protein [Pseudomonadota bacterium]